MTVIGIITGIFCSQSYLLGKKVVWNKQLGECFVVIEVASVV